MKKELELYIKLLNYVRGWLGGRQYFTAMEALEFARSKHVGTRKDGATPEFSHQLHIVRFFINLANLLPNPERVITLSLLHDVVEDGYATIEQIRLLFGDDIANGVILLSKVLNGLKVPGELYYGSMLNDADVCIVKGGDRLHNLESMIGVFTLEKQQSYVEETEQFTLTMLKAARNKYPRYADAINTIRHAMIIYTKMVRDGLEKSKS